jgi:hypothetical protein
MGRILAQFGGRGARETSGRAASFYDSGREPQELTNMMKQTIGAVLVGMLALGAIASADDAKPKAPQTQPSKPADDKKPSDDKPAEPPAGSSSASAEVHVGTGYANHAVTGEAATFPAGTKVFVVSVVSGANGTQVKHVWKKDGAEIWTATLDVGSEKWTTSSRRLLSKAGAYEVDVVGADGAELGKVEFQVQ